MTNAIRVEDWNELPAPGESEAPWSRGLRLGTTTRQLWGEGWEVAVAGRPIDQHSLVGFVALTGECYCMRARILDVDSFF